MSNDSKVVELRKNNLHDIPALMERVAAEVRAGEHGKIEAGVCLLLDENGDPQIFGWGDADPIRAIALFTIGANWLAARKTTR